MFRGLRQVCVVENRERFFGNFRRAGGV
jgi:hypothetical protein